VLKPKHPIGLLLTCRQLHNEAALLVYQHFTFAFDMISPATVNHRTGGGPFDDVRKIPRTLLHFLRLRTTAQRLAIRHLELVTWIAREMWMQICAPFTPQHFLFLDQTPNIKTLHISMIVEGRDPSRILEADRAALEALIRAKSAILELTFQGHTSRMRLGVPRWDQ
jgi:hypothetical protein